MRGGRETWHAVQVAHGHLRYLREQIYSSHYNVERKFLQHGYTHESTSFGAYLHDCDDISIESQGSGGDLGELVLPLLHRLGPSFIQGSEVVQHVEAVRRGQRCKRRRRIGTWIDTLIDTWQVICTQRFVAQAQANTTTSR